MYLWQFLIFQGYGLGVRTCVRTHSHVTTKMFENDMLPNFPRYGAPLARSGLNQCKLSIVPSVIHLLWNLDWWSIYSSCRYAIKCSWYLRYKSLLNLICYGKISNDRKYGGDISSELEWIHRTNNDGNFLCDLQRYTWIGSVSYLLIIFVWLSLILICSIRKTSNCVWSQVSTFFETKIKSLCPSCYLRNGRNSRCLFLSRSHSVANVLWKKTAGW